MPLIPLMERFLTRVSDGRGTDKEIEVFPDVLRIYAEVTDGGTGEEPSVPSPAREEADGFPAGETLVDGDEAAKFLGFDRNKFPRKAVLRLSSEGKIPAPIRSGTKTFRWKASWIRNYRARLEADAEKHAVKA